MNRKTTGEDIRNIISKLRHNIPGVIIRTTVMVGFPGETEEDFKELYNFVKDEKFDKLGAFSYSKEDSNNWTYCFKVTSSSGRYSLTSFLNISKNSFTIPASVSQSHGSKFILIDGHCPLDNSSLSIIKKEVLPCP